MGKRTKCDPTFQIESLGYFDDFQIFVSSLDTQIALQNDTKIIMIGVVVAKLWQCEPEVSQCTRKKCFEKTALKV